MSKLTKKVKIVEVGDYKETTIEYYEDKPQNPSVKRKIPTIEEQMRVLGYNGEELKDKTKIL